MGSARFKILAALLVLALLSGCASASVLTIPNILTLEYPDEWKDFGADDSDDVENEYYNLGFIGGRGATDLNICLDLNYLEQFADFRLFDGDDQIAQDFASWLINDYENGKLLQIRRVGAHEIPFVILKIQDSYGPSYVAETLTNGWDLSLTAYAYTDSSYDVSRELTSEDLATFLAVVDSIEPIVN